MQSMLDPSSALYLAKDWTAYCYQAAMLFWVAIDPGALPWNIPRRSLRSKLAFLKCVEAIGIMVPAE
jgi:hypothetical protein